jgi:hypothetical protein
VAAQKRVGLERKLGRLAELSDRTKELRTRHDMTARANAEQRVRLQAAYGGEELLDSREALEAILADLGDPEADQAELRQLTRELDVRGAPCFAVCRDVPGDAQCSASPGLSHCLLACKLCFGLLRLIKIADAARAQRGGP